MRKDPISIDASGWPIVVITYDRRYEDAEFKQHLDELMRFLERCSPMAFISDIDRSPPPPAKQRRMMADMLRENHDALGSYCRAWAQVAKSSIARGVITAVQWIQSPPFPTRAVATLGEAHRWVRAELDRSA